MGRGSDTDFAVPAVFLPGVWNLFVYLAALAHHGTDTTRPGPSTLNLKPYMVMPQSSGMVLDVTAGACITQSDLHSLQATVGSGRLRPLKKECRGAIFCMINCMAFVCMET